MMATDQALSVVEQVKSALVHERIGKPDEVEQILQALDRAALMREIEGRRGSNASKGNRSVATVAPTDRADPTTTIEDMLITFERDKYTCRYCGKQLVLVAALRVLSIQHPQVFPFHKNWKLAECHPIYWTHGAICGHIKTIASGGASNLENLATMCVACMYKENAQYGDSGRVLRTVQEARYWTGLSIEFSLLCLAKPHVYKTGDLGAWYKALRPS